MINKLNKAALSAFTMLTVMLFNLTPAFAFNPATGDESGPIKLAMAIALVISVILIILVIVLSILKKKKNQK